MHPRLYFWVILILIGISLISGAYIFSLLQSRGLDLEIEAPEEVLIGVPFDVRVNFGNDSGSVLEEARLTLVLPEGAAFWGSDPGKNLDNRSLGNIGEGSLIQQDYKVIIFSDKEESVKNFSAVLNYSSAALGNARFEKKEEKNISVGGSGIAVDLSTPDAINSGEEFELKVSYKNNSDFDFTDLELKLDYPASFYFGSASLKPDSENNLWKLGDLRKGSAGEFTIKGSLIGGQGDKLEFKQELSTRQAGQRYLIGQGTASITIESTPINLSVALNGVSDYIAKPAENLNYTISYVNGTEFALRNLAVRAQLIGEMFDFSSLQTNGFFRASDNLIVWDANNNPALALVPPGSAGIVTFSVKTKSAYPVRRFGDKNFILKINAEIESLNVPPDLKVSRLFNKTRLESKVAGNLEVQAKAYFRDAESGILNKGPLPPKAGQPTNFTIHWSLKNFAVDVSGVEIQALLGKGVKVVSDPKSNTNFLPVYDSGSNSVVWKIDRSAANLGVVSNPNEAVFQVEVVPDQEDVGKYLQIIGETIAKATDDFTGAELISKDTPITTALPDDLTIGQQGGVVQP